MPAKPVPQIRPLPKSTAGAGGARGGVFYNCRFFIGSRDYKVKCARTGPAGQEGGCPQRVGDPLAPTPRRRLAALTRCLQKTAPRLRKGGALGPSRATAQSKIGGSFSPHPIPLQGGRGAPKGVRSPPPFRRVGGRSLGPGKDCFQYTTLYHTIFYCAIL